MTANFGELGFVLCQNEQVGVDCRNKQPDLAGLNDSEQILGVACAANGPDQKALIAQLQSGRQLRNVGSHEAGFDSECFRRLPEAIQQ